MMSDPAPADDAATPDDSAGEQGPGAASQQQKKQRSKKAPFNPAAFVQQRNLWWYGAKNIYYRQGPDGNWLELRKEDMIMWLQAEGLRRGESAEPTREVELVLMYVQGMRSLAGVMNLAGHVPGVEVIRGQRVLIREGPCLIEPMKGEWPLIGQICWNLFCLPLETPHPPAAWRLLDEAERDYARESAVWKALLLEQREEVPAAEGEEKDGSGAASPHQVNSSWFLDQRVVVWTWIKLGLEILYKRAADAKKEPGVRQKPGAMRNGQALAIAGPPKGGKSLFFSNILGPLFGNRMSSAAKFLTGKTQFNSSLFGSELLVMSDTPLSSRMEDRNTLGDGIKVVAAEQWHSREAKGVDAQDQLNPIWRLVIGLNDDPNNIKTLPPFTVEGVGDKIHLLHACSRPMPVATTTTEEYMAFGRALEAELPAFVHFLLHEWTVPEAMLGGRFGMRTIQSPDLMREMFEESPSGELMELLDLARWTVAGDTMTLWEYVHDLCTGGDKSRGHVIMAGTRPIVWQGAALDLKHLLCDDGCSVHREAQQLFKYNKPQTLLARLGREDPDRVMHHRTNAQRQWRVAVRPG